MSGEAVEWVRGFWEEEAANRRLGLQGQNIAPWLVKGFSYFLKKNEAPAAAPWFPMTVPVSLPATRGLTPAEVAQRVAAVSPPVVFRADVCASPIGEVVRVLCGGLPPFRPTEPHLRLDVATVGGALKVVSLWQICPQCAGTVTHEGTTCAYALPSGPRCEAGWIFQGGLRLELEAPHATERLAEPDHPRFRDVVER